MKQGFDFQIAKVLDATDDGKPLRMKTTSDGVEFNVDKSTRLVVEGIANPGFTTKFGKYQQIFK